MTQTLGRDEEERLFRDAKVDIPTLPHDSQIQRLSLLWATSCTKKTVLRACGSASMQLSRWHPSPPSKPAKRRERCGGLKPVPISFYRGTHRLCPVKLSAPRPPRSDTELASNKGVSTCLESDAIAEAYFGIVLFRILGDNVIEIVAFKDHGPTRQCRQ